jgi:hypothetical protein
MEVEHVYFVIRMKQLNTYSSNVVSQGLYGQSLIRCKHIYNF